MCRSGVSNVLRTTRCVITISSFALETFALKLSRVRLFATPMDCSLPGSSVHGIFQARVLDWVAISFSRGSSWPRDQTQVSCIVGRCFTIWATREVPWDKLGGQKKKKKLDPSSSSSIHYQLIATSVPSMKTSLFFSLKKKKGICLLLLVFNF